MIAQTLEGHEHPTQPAESDTIPAAGGAVLNAHRRGGASAEPVLLINAFGIPHAVFDRLESKLALDHFVVSWESRGVPSERGLFSEKYCDMGTQVADALAVLDWGKIDRANIVGWCSGAQVALRLASQHPDRVRKLVLLNGTYRLPDGLIPQTAHYRDMRSVMGRIASSRAQAAWWVRNMPQRPSPRPSNGGPSAGGVLSEALVALVTHPFRTAESLYRYANLVTRFYDEPDHAWADDITKPTLIVTGEQDDVAHVDTSREIARRIRVSVLHELPNGNHYSLVDSPEISETVAAFLAGGEMA